MEHIGQILINFFSVAPRMLFLFLFTIAMASELNAKRLDENLRNTNEPCMSLPCQISRFLSSSSINIAQKEKAMAIANQLLKNGENNDEQTNDRFNHRQFLFRLLN